MTDPGKPTTPIVLRIKLRYEDVDTLVARFAPNVGKAGLFLPTKSIHPVGTELKFEVRLSGGAPDALPVIVGLGRVKSARDPDAANPRLVFGIGVELMRVTKESREVILKMLERRRAVGLADVGVPTADDVELARRAGGDDNTGIRAVIDLASGPVVTAEVTAPPVPALLPAPAAVVDRPSDALLTAPRRQSGPMAVQRVAVEAVVAPLTPEPSRRVRRTLGDLIASVSSATAAAAASGDMFGADDEVDVQSVLARARTLAAGTDMDAELEALKDSAAAPLAEISIEAASAELARQLGGVAVDRKNRGAKGTGWAVPPPSAPAPAATEIDASPRGDLDAKSPVGESTAALVLAKLAGGDDATDFAAKDPNVSAFATEAGTRAGVLDPRDAEAAPLDSPVESELASSGSAMAARPRGDTTAPLGAKSSDASTAGTTGSTRRPRRFTDAASVRSLAFADVAKPETDGGQGASTSRRDRRGTGRLGDAAAVDSPSGPASAAPATDGAAAGVETTAQRRDRRGTGEPDAFAADADESRPTLEDPDISAPSADGSYDDPAFARAQSEAPETLPETEEVGDDDVVEEIGDADVDEIHEEAPEATVAVIPDPRIYAAAIPTEDPDDVILLPPTHTQQAQQHTIAVDPNRSLLIDDDVDPSVFDDRTLDPDPNGHAELDLDAAQFAVQTSVGPAPSAIATAKPQSRDGKAFGTVEQAAFERQGYGYERETVDPDHHQQDRLDHRQHQLADQLDRALADAEASADEDFSFDEGTRNAAAEQEHEPRDNEQPAEDAELDDFEILDETNLEEGDFVNRLELSNEFAAAPDDPLAGFRDSVVSYGDEQAAYRAPSDPLAGFADEHSDPDGRWDPGTGSYTYAQQLSSRLERPDDRFDSEFDASSPSYSGARDFEDTALPTAPTDRPRGYMVPPEPTTADPDLENALEALDVDLDDLSGNHPSTLAGSGGAPPNAIDGPTSRPVTGSVRRVPRAPRAKSEDDGIMIDFDDNDDE